MASQRQPDLARAARLAGESPLPWPNGNLGVLGTPSIPAAFLLAPPIEKSKYPPDGLVVRDHPVTCAPLPRPVRIDPFGNLRALPRGPRDDVLDALQPALAGVPDKLRRSVERTTRRLLGDRALLDPKAPLDPALLDRYVAALSAAPPFDPKKPGPWRRAVERAWLVALDLPLTVANIVGRLRARGGALGVPRKGLTAGCSTLRSRPLQPKDHGAVARWAAGLDKLKDAAGWARYAQLGWGRARQASVAAHDRARRRGCGRQTNGSAGGQRQRCGTHGCGHADCAPRQAVLAGESSRPHAAAWRAAGVTHVRIGLTLPRRGDWTPIEAMDALDPCASPFVRELARSLGWKLAARIVVERQADGTPEWVFILADVDGNLTRRMLAEDADYMVCNQYDPPPVSLDLLAVRTRIVTNAGIRTADLWPGLTGAVQAAADAAAAKAGIAWEATYIAPVFDLDGTWSDVHKAAQATGHDWPKGFKRFRPSRGTKDGLVLPYAAAWAAAGGAPSNRREGQQQRRAAEDRADAYQAAQTLEEAPEIPGGQGAARDASDAARAAANDAAAKAARSAAARDVAIEAADLAYAWADEYASRSKLAARAYVDAEAALRRLIKAAERADNRALRARAHVGRLVREHAIERAEGRAGEAEAEAEAAAQAVDAADLVVRRMRRESDDAAEQARVAAEAAEDAVRDADEATATTRSAEWFQERTERSARRREQLAQDAPDRRLLERRRARAAALLDGPLPLERPPPLTGRWSPCRPPPEPGDDDDDERPSPSWTLTDTVELLRAIGPPGMEVQGRIGMDGEIAAYRVTWPAVPWAPPEPEPLVPVETLRFDFSSVEVVESPELRLDAVGQRLRRDRSLGSHTPAGLPWDLSPFADPLWGPVASDSGLTDADIEEVQRRYVLAAVRRAATTTRALCSAGLPIASAAAWRAAAVDRGVGL